MRVNTVGLEQGRSRLPELAARANAGEPSLLTRHGKPFAAIVAPDVLDQTLQQQQRRRTSFVALRGSGKGLWGPSPAEFIAKIRDEWE